MAEAKIISFADKLRDFVTGLGGARDRTVSQSFDTTSFYTVPEAELESMYRSDWVSRKIVDIVPQDMVRAGRQWKADNEIITQIEAVENSLPIQLWPKLKRCLTKARLLGGAALLVGIRGQSPASPLDLDSIQQGSLSYLTVLHKTRLSWAELDLDPQSTNFGEPKMWTVTMGDRTVDLHPSRVVKFVGAPNEARDDTDRTQVWGDSLLQIVYEAVKNAASSQQHVAGLVPDARSDVIYIPGLGQILQSPQETTKLTQRFGYARTIKSMYNLLLLEGNGGSGEAARGESWEQRQISFTQLPELVRQFLQIAAGAADIPITRFLGESPGGENSTGEADMRNYYDHVAALQKLVLGPALLMLDQVIQRSATGTYDPKIHYTWSPLWALKETEKAEILHKKSQAMRWLSGGSQDIPIVDRHALSDAAVVTLTEDGSLPGIEDAVERHGSLDKTMPDAMERPEPAPAFGEKPPSVKKAANDAEPRTLVVYRRLLNTSEFVKWASDQGLRGIQNSDDLHVTVLFSRTPVDWMQMGSDIWSSEKGKLTVPPGGPRVVESLGDATAVLLFSSSMLSWRHREMIEAGASSDFDEYVAHITISYDPQEVDLRRVEPFRGELRFGPEIFQEIDPVKIAQIKGVLR